MEDSASFSPSSSSSGSSTPSSYSETHESVDIIVEKIGSSNFNMSKPKGGIAINADQGDPAQKSEASRGREGHKPWDPDQAYHDSLFSNEDLSQSSRAQNARLGELRTTPLFSAEVLRVASNMAKSTSQPHILPQYGLLSKIEDIHGCNPAPCNFEAGPGDAVIDRRLFLNTNAPWSAFVCGSQGSGKSHTLSCMLEDALLNSYGSGKLGKLPHPLAGIVFHYDKFTGHSSSQVCEAAFLCSTGIPVKILVSPASYDKMKRVYANLPGVKPKHQPTVVAMLFEQQHLNASRMMKLMAVEGTDGSRPLYMEVVCRILRQIAMASQGAGGFDLNYFKYRLGLELFNPAQEAMLATRLDLLQDFLQPQTSFNAAQQSAKKPKFSKDKKGKEMERKWLNEQHQQRQAAMVKKDIWSFKPGSLTIVDLSCPFIDEGTACDLFDICLSIFLEPRGDLGRIVALDEAHKFMGETKAASTFTETLLSVIRLQRHQGTRVIVATQEPTISPKLLDLCSMTIVHRFTSPSWLQALKSHLAGVSPFSTEDQGRDIKEIFAKIVELEAGEALLFSPSMILNIMEGNAAETTAFQTKKLGTGYAKIRVRKRLTADGGRSIMAA